MASGCVSTACHLSGAGTLRHVDNGGAGHSAVWGFPCASTAPSDLTMEGSCRTFSADSRGCSDPVTLRVQPRGRRGPAVHMPCPHPEPHCVPVGGALLGPAQPLCPQSPFPVLLGQQDHSATSRFPCIKPTLSGGPRGWEPEAGLAGAVLRQSLPESCHQLPCRCVRVRVRSSSVAPAARGSTCSPLRRRHVSTQRPTSPSNHPHHPLDKRLERVHSAHLPVKVPPRVSCRLVTLGSVPSRTHCPQQLVFAQRYH